MVRVRLRLCGHYVVILSFFTIHFIARGLEITSRTANGDLSYLSYLFGMATALVCLLIR
jgi:hypothetical protein